MTDDYNDLNVNDENEEEENGGTPPPSQNNRTFLIAAGILGGLFLLGLLLIALFVFVLRPGQQRQQQIAALNQSNTATAFVLTQGAAQAQTAIPKAATNTPQVTLTIAVAQVTNTPVIAIPTETTVNEQTQAAERNTATVSALLTQVAQAQLTSTGLPTSTALPTTGFADEVGIPGLFGLAIVLMAVIFLVRRLRTA